MRLTHNITRSRIRGWLLVKAVTLGPVAALLLASPAIPLAAADASGSANRPFVGDLPRGGTVLVRLSRDDRRVKTAKATLWLACDSGGGLYFPDRYDGLRVRHGSRISASFKTSGSNEGVEYQLSGSMNARMNPRHTRISGTWRVSMDLRMTETGETDHCDSGDARFAARR